MKTPIIIAGAGRSGTTFIGKLFDSHPNVLYRHEPDGLHRNPAIPMMPSLDELQQYADQTREYLDFLLTVRDVKTSTKTPFFPKNFRNPIQKSLHVGACYFFKLMERILNRKIPGNVVPDFANLDNDNIHIVMKMVASHGRLPLFHSVRPDWKYIHIVRHPCGVVASRMRGAAQGVVTGDAFAQELFKLPDASKYSFTEKEVAAFNKEEAHAFNWMIHNDKTLQEMQGKTNYKLVKHEDLCTDTIPVLKDLFEFAGLAWNDQSEDFINQLNNTHATGSRYFSVMKSPAKEAMKWRKELTEQQVEDIRKIVQDSAIGALYFPQ